MSSEEDFISNIAKGMTRGVIDWSSEKVMTLIKKFKNKELAFIEDIETIDIAKEQRKTTEFDFFKKYIADKHLRILFQMGLTLRKLEKANKDLQPLKEKISNKYDIKGLHIAYFVQNGLFSKYIGSILEKTTPQRVSFEIKNLLKNITKIPLWEGWENQKKLLDLFYF